MFTWKCFMATRWQTKLLLFTTIHKCMLAQSPNAQSIIFYLWTTMNNLATEKWKWSGRKSIVSIQGSSSFTIQISFTIIYSLYHLIKNRIITQSLVKGNDCNLKHASIQMNWTKRFYLLLAISESWKLTHFMKWQNFNCYNNNHNQMLLLHQQPF